MKETLKEVKDTLITNPTVAFVMVTLGAVYLLYTDLSQFIHEQQKILTNQVQQ
jgi:membrane-bound ClpP family serine protease